jgi:anti-anti-sigma factor
LDNTIGKADLVRRAFDSLLPVAEPRRTAEFSTELVDDCLVVAGDIDNGTAPTLGAQIARQSRSGTYALNVDLSAVTHLGSKGLRVLAQARERAHQHGSELGLIAPPGSPAHHVLMLVGSRCRVRRSPTGSTSTGRVSFPRWPPHQFSSMSTPASTTPLP